MTEELKVNLNDLIQAAVDLANSVREDIKDQGYISEKTILLLNDFRFRHEDMETVLDIMNGVN